jgi:hypothetical protein
MKRTNLSYPGLAAMLLLTMGAAITAQAAPALQAQLILRPVTSSDLGDYKLPTGTEMSGGLNTVGVGQAVYLEADINLAVPAADILSVTWALTNTPLGSAAILTNSPLGTNVPIHDPIDRLSLQVAGRALFRADVRGQYTVVATVTTGSSGTTNVSKVLTAGTYVGLSTCQLCHSGGLIAENMFTPWSKTLHARIFTDGVNGVASSHYSSSCFSCHTVGFDANPLAVNGGFDDVAKQLGWTLPTVLTNSNWAAVPAAIKNVGNIQCENCHGPGSEHAYSLGDTNRISVSYKPGDCSQCHDAKTHHIKSPEWNKSKHAITVTDPSGPGREGCVACHTAIGFAGKMSGASTTNTTYEAITCQACHDPHDASKPHQLRSVGPVTLANGTTITNTGTAVLCMNCHRSRQNASTYVDNTVGSSRFGPHHGPQTDMLLGVNGYEYGKVIPSSAHRDSVTNSCVTCHMQPTAATDPAFLLAGGHTFSMGYSSGTTNIEMVAACAQCHGGITTFDFPRQDFDGNGVVEGVQTEVKGLLNKLSFLLPPAGVAKTNLNITSTWTKPQLRAGFNYSFVAEDKSFGVHNLAYAVGLLKASIADLTGDANNDGLPDAWQIQYFGSATNPNAAPNATPAGDGVPNWLKYALGLDPTVAGAAVPGGVVWANGKTIVSPGGTNAVQIYTAAEVAFNTAVGKTYQVQGISSLGGGWQNIGAPIAGTGNSISYVAPTRQNTQQFFRVLHN